MFDIVADLEKYHRRNRRKVELEASDDEELLVAWLDELLYNFYTKQIIFFQISYR